MSGRLPILLFLLGSLATPLPASGVGTGADTTVAGRTYALLSATDLMAQLREARKPIHLREKAVTGPLYAPSVGLDTVRVALYLEDVLFFDEVNLNKVVFLAPLRGERAVFAGGLSLLGARFRDDFALRESHSARHFNFKQARFDSAVDLSAGHFAESISFIETHFGGQARFDRCTFGAAAYFEKARFADSGNFRDAHFTGVASFKDVVWTGDAVFAGARFDQRVLFWRAHFNRAADFAAVRADGEASFNGMVCAGRADFTDFTFAQNAHFADTAFDRAAFAGAYFRKVADFSGVAARTLRLKAFFNHELDLRHAVVGTLDLRRGANADSTFADAARIYLNQGYFDRILVRWATLRGHLAIADSSSLAALEPTYAALRHQFLRRGLTGDAEHCQIERLEHERQALTWSEPKRWTMELWHKSSHYGTNPTRLVISILSFILLFGLIYRLGAHAMRPAYGEGSPTLADCIGFSIHIFTRAGYRAWHATGHLKLLVSVEALVGWISLALLIAVVLANLL